MLLHEGMNIKVLLLPDGDDPDSFSRKHSAEEFRAYIEEHQTDFIQFKTDLMLRGVTDPVKRSEAISNIVKSISVISDRIKRDAYLHDCAQRVGANERTLLASLNNFVREAREDSSRHEVRGTGYENSSEAEEGVQGNLEPRTSNLEPRNASASSEPERLLIQMVIRHGDEMAIDGVETADGQTISLTVAQFIDYNLSQDELQFSDPLPADAHGGC